MRQVQITGLQLLAEPARLLFEVPDSWEFALMCHLSCLLFNQQDAPENGARIAIGASRG
eukprot:CAMPEP_0195261348 /NCGR_PEP_ID=MMETSP0706-20130129/9093_1 /TAXON_ID=33640 /ORGANISM="Asterionellopsis glacialis, Strain CCMP134" /LENGTH=58 /DNA_ID=CAMNT_0040315195 /DNA_START=145 /DNA_END=321 /DNA_ORIENTATION=+